MGLCPLLASIGDVGAEKGRVFPLVLACGTSVNTTEFLVPTMQELNSLEKDGLEVGDVTLPFKVDSCICDSPARAKMKDCKSHMARVQCHFCTLVGTKGALRTVCFPALASTRLNEGIPRPEKRTDATFRNHSQPVFHQNPIGILSTIEHIENFDCTLGIPYEYMHQVCSGVFKRLLCEIWINSSRKNPDFRKHYWSASKQETVNIRLLRISEQLCGEFTRRPKTLASSAKYKAHENRLLLLYIFPVILSDILEKRNYRHFLAFSCAVTILLNPALLLKYSHYADKLMTIVYEEGMTLTIIDRCPKLLKFPFCSKK